MNAIKMVVDTMEYDISSTIGETLRRFLRVIGKYHVSASNGLIKHLRHKVNIINQRIDNGDKVA
ncbi:hypothetical protein D3C75_1316360 [compost metagenome]